MIWLTKTYGYGARWSKDQNVFEHLLFRVAAWGTGEYRRMLMVRAEDDEDGQFQNRIFICLPSETLGTLFPGYTSTTGPLPNRATL